MHRAVAIVAIFVTLAVVANMLVQRAVLLALLLMTLLLSSCVVIVPPVRPPTRQGDYDLLCRPTAWMWCDGTGVRGGVL